MAKSKEGGRRETAAKNQPRGLEEAIREFHEHGPVNEIATALELMKLSDETRRIAASPFLTHAAYYRIL